MLSAESVILLVEDDPGHAELIARAFAERGVVLLLARNLAEARRLIAAHALHLIISDLQLPDGRGNELLAASDAEQQTPVVLMTSYGNEQIAVEAVKAGALDYVVKSAPTLVDLPWIAERALREWGHLVERRRAEATLRRNERLFRAMIERSSDVIAVLDATGTIRYASPSTTRIMGHLIEQHLGADFFGLIHPDDRSKARRFFTTLLQEPDHALNSEMRYCHADGNWRWIEATGTNLLDDPAVEGVVINYRDISERKLTERRMHHEALHDALTDLPNRILFNDRLEQAIYRSRRNPEYRFAVLFLDIDHFKVINDSLGHPAGDRLLIRIADQLQSCLRACDTCARLGGDEFVILVDDFTDEADVLRIAERMQQRLAEPLELDGRPIRSSASIGIVFSELGYDNPTDLMRDADIVMYRAKAAGKARAVIFAPEMREAALAAIALEADLRRAIEQAEFFVYYQPIVAINTGVLIGFEALVRWQHPTHGILSPAAFIGAAESAGLIELIDWQVLASATSQLTEWRRDFPHAASLTVSVNLSAHQLGRPYFSARVLQILADNALPPSNLKLEITESALIENSAAAAIVLQELRTHGVQIAIDDFGTGYSSLGYLVKLPIDQLKIDRNFVEQLDQPGGQSEIVSTIVGLAHSLGLDVVAEGLETPSQAEQLRALGCAFGQGYLLGPPQPALDATALIAEQRALSY